MLPESAAVLPNQLKRDLSEEEERSLSHPPSPADIEKAVASATTKYGVKFPSAYLCQLMIAGLEPIDGGQIMTIPERGLSTYLSNNPTWMAIAQLTP